MAEGQKNNEIYWHLPGLCYLGLLNNVLIRCRLYYGDAARLDVESRRNGGAVFTLIVPVRWKKEDFHVSGSDCG